jgi:hypothetical protein
MALDMPVTGALQGVMITGIHARRFFAMPADSGKSRVFAQRGDPVILRMIKIIAGNRAFLTLITNV